MGGSDRRAHAEYVNEHAAATEAQHLATHAARLRALADGTFRDAEFECCLLYGAGAMTPPAPLPEGVTPEGVADGLCKAAPTTVTLAHVGGALGEGLARALRANQGIRHFRLRHMQNVGADACLQLVRAAAGCPRLKTLELCECGLSPQGAGELGRLLAAATELKEVGVGWNRALDGDGLVPICEGMAANTSVTSLDIKGIDPGPRGTAALAAMLTRNSALHYLDLEYCHLGEGGAQTILAALRLNGSVRGLRLHSNDIPQALRKEIEEVAGRASDRDFLWYHCLDKDLAKTIPDRLEEGLLEAARAGEVGLERVGRILERLAAHPQLQAQPGAAGKAAGRVLRAVKKSDAPGAQAVAARLKEAAAE